jgi:hypothetical protein
MRKLYDACPYYRVFWFILILISLNIEPIQAQKKSKTPKKLDLNNPEDALKADRKLGSSLIDGEPVIYWWYGNVFSRVPGEKDRLLFTYQAMNIRASKTFNDPQKGYGYRQVSKELLLYMDPQTGAVLKTWKNPFTNEENEVVHIANDPVNMRAPTFAKGEKGDYKFRGTIQDGTVLLLTEVPLFYTNPLGGEYQEFVGGTYQAMEIFYFSVSEDELLNAEKNTAENAVVSWCRVSKWLPWMKMNDRMGQMIFTGHGKKLKNFESLPEVLKQEIKTNYPEYATPPALDDARPNETSWTYFKKYIEKKKAK